MENVSNCKVRKLSGSLNGFPDTKPQGGYHLPPCDTNLIPLLFLVFSPLQLVPDLQIHNALLEEVFSLLQI